MRAIASAIGELWGLFVEDPTFTLGMLVCLVIARFLFPAIQMPSVWRGVALFVMLALVLVENVLRSARVVS